jgi:hypothetical protein
MNKITKNFNRRWATVVMGSQYRVHELNTDRYFTIADFRNLTMDQTIMGGDDKPMQCSNVWLADPDRNHYKGVMFHPAGVPKGWLNTYEGLTVEPVKGDWSLFQDHIHTNVCGGRTDYYNWLIEWMGHIVQKPDQKIGTAIVIRGLKGTGKTVFADHFGYLFGNHFQTLNSGSQVTNRFNTVYERCILLCADEAVWGGDKKGEGILKGLITAPKIFIERKFFDGKERDNFTHFDMGQEWLENFDKFAALQKQMENGGYEAMLYDLLNLKIMENLRKPIVTKALIEQVYLNEHICIQFWRHKVAEADPDTWPIEIMKSRLYQEMVDYCVQRKSRQMIVSNAIFFKKLRNFINPWVETKKTNPVNPTQGRVRYLTLPNHKICTEALL